MAFIVVYDACVPHQAALRDLLIRVAQAGMLVRLPNVVEVKHPDDFVLESIELAPGRIAGIVAEQAPDLRSPARTAREVLDTPAETDALPTIDLLARPTSASPTTAA